MIHIRAFQSADAPHLARFLALAAHESDEKTVSDNPDLARYIVGFGRARGRLRCCRVRWRNHHRSRVGALLDARRSRFRLD